MSGPSASIRHAAERAAWAAYLRAECATLKQAAQRSLGCDATAAIRWAAAQTYDVEGRRLMHRWHASAARVARDASACPY